MKSFRVLVVMMLLQVFSIVSLMAQTVLPFGQITKQPWEAKYFHHASTDGSVTPGENWYAMDFDDSSWDSIAGPISNDNFYHATAWQPEYSTYWVRRHFTLESASDNMSLALRLIHDNDCWVYLNGQLVYENHDWVRNANYYTMLNGGFLEGDNLIAIKVVNTGGEACLDFGLETETDENGIRYLGTTAMQVIDGSLTEFTIREGTTHIADNLFAHNSNITKCIIPEGVVSIGQQAFFYCQNLQEINIPSSVETIGANAFYYCNSFPVENGIRYADSYALEVIDKSLGEYTLKENTRYLGNDLFSGCSSMISITIPSGLKEIGDNTFHNCQLLQSLTLPEGVVSIGEQAFYGCMSLQSVNIPAGVKAIGNRTFYNCQSLRTLTLPDGIVSIGLEAFRDCKALQSVNIPSGVNCINRATFYNCNSLKSLVLPEDATFNGDQIFYNCNALQSVNIPSGVKEIPYDTFYECQSLKSLTLPDELTRIGYNAFYNCKSLASINIPSGVKTIERSTFYNCESLKSLVLPEGVTSIGNDAFYYCRALESINIPSGVKSIEGSTFQGCRALKYLTLHDGINKIDNWAFYDCDALKTIDFPDGLIYIGEYAFYDCNSLDSISLPEGLVSISHSAFHGCGQITYFEFPSSLASIGEYNMGNDNMTIVSRATTPPNIAGGCSNKLIYVPAGTAAAYRELYPNNVIVDGEGTELTVAVAEAGTFGEEALKLTESLSDINNLIISGNINNNDIECIRNNMPNLIAIDFSAVDMEVIPNDFLSDKRNILKLVLPNNTKEIGSGAFRYLGRMKQVQLPESLTIIGPSAFFGTGLTSIVIPDGVTSIGNSAFDDCYYLESVTLPSAISRIESHTFSSCRSLKSIDLPQQITSIGDYAFEGCSSLTSITLPPELTEIISYTFASCSALTAIEIPSKVTTIHSHAFQHCSNLENVSIGGFVKNVRENAFYDCNKLNSITCQALFPPSTNGSIAPNGTCVLYVPELTLSKYKLASNWGAFVHIEPISGIYPNDIYVFNEESLDIPDTGLPQDYTPNLILENQNYDQWNNSGVGKFTVKGTMPLTLSTFEMHQSRDVNTMTALVNKGSMSADNVKVKLNFQTDRWHFLSFPYDVKVSDIVTEGDWVIRYYDGELRAQGDYDNTWQNVPYDSILHAGVGYIWHSTHGNFEVPAMDNTNKYLIFSNETRYAQLSENVSSNAADNGWNLVGNPYPCFYDTRFMEFTSPITVRIDGYNYSAYSPLDDSYILSPFEAFFVQSSGKDNLMGFNVEGRQTDNYVREISTPSRTRAKNSNRCVFNLYLENENYIDHTRFVINENASIDYEIAFDAAKFMSDDPAVHQLFTLENGERMAINERPMANGEVALGIYVGKAGSYTFSMDTKDNGTEVMLVDRLTETITDLTVSDYTFTTEAGTFTDRFVVCMKSGVADGIENAVNVEIVTAEGLISIRHASAQVQIYDAAGALIGTKSGEDVTFEVPSGIYMVKVGSEVHKVSVMK